MGLSVWIFLFSSTFASDYIIVLSAPAKYSHNNGVTTVNDDSFSVNSNTFTKNGKCWKTLTIEGTIIKDTFTIPCTNPGITILNLKNILIIGDPKLTPFTIYSDNPYTLVVMINGSCIKKTYTWVNGKTSITSLAMSAEQCSQVKQMIANEQEKQRIYWETWSKNFEKQMRQAFPPGFPFNQ